ncbi:acyl-CoA dehydrogenase family protein [Metapseudomonas furukawaii]|uniref:Butyryl-CoA dehydrogenase n=1 Tax=Metapseudomonas furukawaii TaxID=1149133 RepID=A0AAD1FE77_METFU|nr:acyl-CoA dehydrogenase family protein [Pseudomonas furukawaii]ELS27319.1 acyl-CoA dehydrogenase protein [Pseudomonas furukawaii]BAU72896.1 butyryl-CoA dehydrogenase [Pseudomonas furukawaii]
MEFAFSDEQEMIRESAESFLADVSDSAAVRAAMASERGYDPELWQRLCREMVWPAIHIPEAHGGLGLGFVELAILLEQMGRRLFCSPFFATACLATPALLLAGNEAPKARWLPQLADGSLTATLAYASNSANGLEAVHASVRAEGKGYVIEGRLRQVVDGHSAGLLIVAARGASGIALFAVPADTPGVRRRLLPTLDQTRKLAEVELAHVYLGPEARLDEDGQGAALLEKVLQLACVAQAAEQVGGAQQALDLTLAYVSERQQFGRSIASFQAIKHRMADMMLQLECARSAALYAACVAEEALVAGGDAQVAAELPLASALAKARCSEAFFHCAAESIQLHGGVGFTWEYDPHLYFKRARASEAFLGAPSWHRERIATALLGEPA